ncbi:MAG: FAD-dependent oxidoreductase, partial [Phycisphaerales bacterium]|nr:FAD-dependent oxidoreductase [Phycisphaerales bacterium]
IVVGAGIVGLAHARAAALDGQRVLVLDKDGQARSASVRNFGMFWLVGQARGPALDRAVRSRRVWLDIAQETGLRIDECGSLHLAYHDVDLRVLREFIEREPDRDVTLVSPEEAAARSPGVRPEGLLGALWSPTELAMDPREAIPAVTRWLRERHRVTFEFAAPVVRARPGHVETADGSRYDADQVILCNGADLTLLCPDVFSDAPITRCKL